MLDAPRSALTREQHMAISRARTLNSAGIKIVIDDRTLCGLIYHIIKDIGPLASADVETGLPNYYDVPLDHIGKDASRLNLSQYYLLGINIVQNFEKAFDLLCEIHKRRLKFHLIRQSQPICDIADLSPRSLLESGLSPAATAATLRSRKHLYDLDNRIAQESGYLFMKLIASAMGGAYHSARTSPIRHSVGEMKRRPVDIVIEKDAYDFKCRMTEAASKRARFEDELRFPRDCHVSGYRPILLALHQLPGERTDELTNAYQRYDGMIFTGQEAWHHINEKAGASMSKFLKNYVLGRMTAVENAAEETTDMRIRTTPSSITSEVRTLSGLETCRVSRN